MAQVKYLGKKENFGPLKLGWMVKPIKFDKNGTARGVDTDTALALVEEFPQLFQVSGLTKVSVKEELITSTPIELLKTQEG